MDVYLRELSASLCMSRVERDRILAEAEDHLRESIAAGLAAGLTEAEAQEAAISAFGSVNAVVRAHERARTVSALLAERRRIRSRGRFAGRWFPALAAGFFGIATMALVLLTQHHAGVPLLVPKGPGTYLSGAVVTGVATAGYGVMTWRSRTRVSHRA
jgi:hypothetical protein